VDARVEHAMVHDRALGIASRGKTPTPSRGSSCGPTASRAPGRRSASASTEPAFPSSSRLDDPTWPRLPE
jgi:hypothetical protein